MPAGLALRGEQGHIYIRGIEALHPQLILLSVDATDRRGLPDPETLEVVQGYPLLRTDRNGWIHLATDGERMWVEAERR